MNIAVVGAGFAGLSTAKVLRTFGHQVTVFEQEPDVGGVWSASRRYPGLSTQNVRSTYALSDFPYPAGYPEWPSGEQVQRYLEAYVQHFGLAPHLRLNTEVVSAQLGEAGGPWTVQTRDRRDGQVATQVFEYLVVCNGIFSEPVIPQYDGAQAFVEAGGRVLHTSEVLHLDDVRGKDVVVVGYGKSSCDVAQAVSAVARSTTVVARSLIWKVPRKLMNVLNYKYLLLTRLGEGLFQYISPRGAETFLHGPGRPLRNAMLRQVQWVVTRQCRLRELGLLPRAPFETVARSTVSLVTEGFYESVARGRIGVRRDTAVTRLRREGAGFVAELARGGRLPVDVLICGTGWTQRVPFLPAAVQTRITDAAGNFRLYRSMLPVGVPRLAFNGYNSSLFSQLNCEIGALWLTDLLGGGLTLPPEQTQAQDVDRRLAWMQERTEGKHARGTNIIPFSVHHLDELLSDLKLPLPRGVRLKQWLLPIDPRDFAPATTRLLQRYSTA